MVPSSRLCICNTSSSPPSSAPLPRTHKCASFIPHSAVFPNGLSTRIESRVHLRSPLFSSVFSRNNIIMAHCLRARQAKIMNYSIASADLLRLHDDSTRYNEISSIITAPTGARDWVYENLGNPQMICWHGFNLHGYECNVAFPISALNLPKILTSTNEVVIDCP